MWRKPHVCLRLGRSRPALNSPAQACRAVPEEAASEDSQGRRAIGTLRGEVVNNPGLGCTMVFQL